MQYLELPEDTRLSLLRGFVERSWCAPGSRTDADALLRARIADPEAYADGQRLRTVLDAVSAAASFGELNAAERAYDAVAAELNDRHGHGLVVGVDEGLELGLRGFRCQGFATRSSVLVGEDLVAG